MSSSTKIDNRKSDIFILFKAPTYSINFTVTGKKFWLSVYYNEANSYFFVNGKKKFINSKQKILRL